MDPEVSVDPLTGLKSIVAGDRAARPGGGFEVAAPEPIDEAGDPFLEGHEDQTPPEVHAVRPGGGAPDTPGWTVRAVPNQYPALVAGRAASPEPEANPDLFSRAARRGRARGDRQRAAARLLAVGPRRRRSSRPRWRCGARACARTRTRPAAI